MYRILLSLFLLPLLLFYAGAAFSNDEPADSASMVGQVAEVLDATNDSGLSLESDDGALSISYLRPQLPSFQLVLQRLSAPDFATLNHPDSALIRAPPVRFS